MHCIAQDSGTPKNRPDVTQKNRHWRKMHLTMTKKQECVLSLTFKQSVHQEPRLKSAQMSA